MKTLSLNILDIVQNSIRAEADMITIEIEESAVKDIYKIVITDNGKGISGEILENVTDPFVTTRTRRRFGLGLPLLKYHAEITGGNLEVSSEPGKGTVIRVDFSNSHIDRQPLGDISGVLIILIAANPSKDFSYCHSTDSGEYRFNTADTKEYLEVETLSDMALLEDIKSIINENLKVINASGVQFETEY
ncbi:MAG: ATP-binding protein [Bacteroidales bacterium]|nr:ATP-binding protein [Bacteroidales bacterium]